MNPRPFSLMRFGALILLFVAVFAFLGGQFWWLHIEAAPAFCKRAEQVREVEIKSVPLRGPITDSNGTVLAISYEFGAAGINTRALADLEIKAIKRGIENARRANKHATPEELERAGAEAQAAFFQENEKSLQDLASLLAIPYEEVKAAFTGYHKMRPPAGNFPVSPFALLPRVCDNAFTLVGVDWRATAWETERLAYNVANREMIRRAKLWWAANPSPARDLEAAEAEATPMVVENKAPPPKANPVQAPASQLRITNYELREQAQAPAPEDELEQEPGLAAELPQEAVLAQKPKAKTRGLPKDKIGYDIYGHPNPWIKLRGMVDSSTRKQIESAMREVTVVGKKTRVIKVKKYPWVSFQQDFVRDYPNGKLAAHLIGYVDRDGRAIQGVEIFKDAELRGKTGIVRSVRDGKRNEDYSKRTDIENFVPGKTVELTIDQRIQKVCEDEADAAYGEGQPKPLTLSIIVSEPDTGKILALTSRPTYDPAQYNSPILSPIFGQTNIAITVPHEPGSVFKLVPISMAINENMLDLEKDRFYCGAKGERLRVRYGDKEVTLPGDDHMVGQKTGTPGYADVAGIVQESSNNGTVQIALRVTERRGEWMLYNYAKAFGFGEHTKLPTYIPSDDPKKKSGESRGQLHKPGDTTKDERKLQLWNITQVPMGHGVSATPLQVHQAMCVIANGGKLMAPMLINRVYDPADPEAGATEYEPVVRGRPITAQTARAVALMLRNVCKPGGTGTIADIPGYEVAGKTGTAQKFVDGHYSKKRHVGTFSGFFPVENPRIAITVIMNDSQNLKGTYGGAACGPTFKRIAEKTIEILKIPPVPAPGSVAPSGESHGAVATTNTW